MRQRQTGRGKAPRMLVLCLMTLTMILGVLLPGVAFAADDEGVSDLSLYQRASEFTREFGTQLAPGADGDLGMIKGVDDDDKLTAGNAGGFLGYADVLSDDSGVVGWLMNSYTTASATITYDQLENVVPSKEGRGGNAFFQYAGYGEALTKMGLVSTVRENSIGELGRTFSTGAVILVYLLANAAPFLFRSALFMLDALNPFKLFMTVIDGTAAMDLGMLSEIAEYVGGLYETVVDLSVLLLLPMMLALTVLSILMFRSGSASKKLSRYALRVFMIFAGLPLIGATYTGIVEDLNSNVKTGADYANYLVMSSYVDFEGWVEETRLAPPTDTIILNPRTAGEIGNESMTLSDRSLVLEINSTLAGNRSAEALREKYDATSDIDEILGTGGDRTIVADGDSTNYQEEGSFRDTYSLLERHMQTDTYSGSQYDGEVSGQVQKMRSSIDNETDEDIIKMFSLTSSDQRNWKQKTWFEDSPEWLEPVEDWNEARGLFTFGAAENKRFKFGNYSQNIYNSGSLVISGMFYTTDSRAPVEPNADGDGLQPIGNGTSGVVGGLSPLAMYNFLNTSFSDTGLTVFSPDKSASDITRDTYSSVSFAGSGASAFVRWVENFTVMACLAILSIAYGVMMLSAAIKNIPRVLSGVFGTALGSIAFITKLLISTAVMLIQVIGMIFLYTLSEDLIMSLLLNFNEVTSSVSSYFGDGTVALEFARGLLVIVVTGFTTYQLIKNMNVFRELLEEAVTTGITRVMGLLDTSTGGKGLDAAAMSGGRVGSDGKLTNEAKEADAKGLGGLANSFAGGGLAKGAAALLGSAHDVEARREQARQEKDGDAYEAPGIKDYLGNRLDTARDLADAKKKDLAKGAVGIKGKSLERELAAKDQSIRAIANRHDDAKVNGSEPEGKDAADTTGSGQALDEHGNVIRDEYGNAVDANGKAISGAAGVGMGMGGLLAMKDKDGTLLDADGNTYTDEMGNAFREDDKGRLVDENGEFVALGNDGVLQPIGSIPGHNGKPVSALSEASKLDSQRFDADKFADMKEAQDASHYGLDKDGNVVDANGVAMMAKTANGRSPVTLDGNGFVTDKDGNRVKASDMQGKVDGRGFEEVTDPATGETHLQHKGDQAMRNMAAVSGKSKNLTEMAAKSNRANAVAKRAKERVAEMQANGAPPYAVSQAKRFANKADQNAKAMQQRFNSAMQAEGKSPQSSSQRVTQDHVTSAARHATAVHAALGTESQKLQQLKEAGAPAAAVQRQANKVDAVRTEAQQAATIAADTETAHQTGRSFGEVNQATRKLERAETVFGNAQAAHQKAVQQKAPQAEIQKREHAMMQASALLNNAHSEQSRVSRPPSGTPAQIDQATARFSQAQQQHAQATARVKQLQNMGSPQAVQQAQATERRAAAQVQTARAGIQQAESRVQELQQAGAPNSVVQGAKRDVDKARMQAQQAQTTYAQARQQTQQVQKATPPKEQVAQAKKAQVQAARQLQQAQQQKETLTKPAGWRQSAVTVETVGPAAVSPAKSYAALASDGISNYSDYKQRVTDQSSRVQKTDAQLQQAKQRLAAMRTSNRPPQIVREAERQVRHLADESKAQRGQLYNLRENAQGLLKNGKFQPAIASRPIRKDGAMIVNQLSLLENTQAMVDKLSFQEKQGTLTEAGQRQLKMFTSRANGMRRQLVSAGIREDSLTDTRSINESTVQMQQSWQAFVNGTSTETME